MYVQSFMLDGSRRICFISQLKEFDMMALDGNDARIVRWMCKVEPEDRISAVGHRKRPELETMRGYLQNTRLLRLGHIKSMEENF